MQAGLREGDELDGKYRIVRALGSGGMGVVYEAVDRSLGRPLAIKVLAFTDQANHIARERLMREGRAAARISHSSIVHVYEIGSDPELDIDYVAMELLAGEDLHTRLRRGGTLAPEQALQLAIQLTEALVAMHEAGIVHRDIKPRNLFLCASGDRPLALKVLDFGIARSAAEPDTLSKTGDALGSIQYMPPEQLQDIKSADERSDIYSAGAVLFEALVGHPPNTGETLREIVGHIFISKPKPIAELVPQVSVELAAVVDCALQRDPARRYKSAQEMLSVLKGMTVLAHSFPPVSPVRSIFRVSSRHPLRLAAVGLLVLVAGIFTISESYRATRPVPIPAVSHAVRSAQDAYLRPAMPAAAQSTVKTAPTSDAAAEATGAALNSVSNLIENLPKASRTRRRRSTAVTSPRAASREPAQGDASSPAGELSWSELVP
jgi:serine/threonine protein kinase